MRDGLAETWATFSAHKLRYGLAAFGLIWGVISIVLLLAVNAGFRQGNERIFREFGKNIVIIEGGRTSKQAGGGRAGRSIRLNYADLLALKQESKFLADISPELIAHVAAKSDYNDGAFNISGIEPVYQQVRTLELAAGRSLTTADDDNLRRVVIIGDNVGQQLFANRDPIGATLQLNSIPYLIIGKLRKKSQEANYDGFDNDRLFIPYQTMRHDFPTNSEYGIDTLTTIIAAPIEKIADDLNRKQEEAGSAIIFKEDGEIENEIRAILAPRHGLDPADYEALPIWNTNGETVMFNKIIHGLERFFLTVSIITLMLGGLSVMNLLLISVQERTREIGVRKALGATARNIEWQFFREAMALIVASGIVGIVVAEFCCYLINLLPLPARFAGMIIEWQAVIFSMAVLILIGLIAAVYPAHCAARLPPAESLRYES